MCSKLVAKIKPAETLYERFLSNSAEISHLGVLSIDVVYAVDGKNT